MVFFKTLLQCSALVHHFQFLIGCPVSRLLASLKWRAGSQTNCWASTPQILLFTAGAGNMLEELRTGNDIMQRGAECGNILGSIEPFGKPAMGTGLFRTQPSTWAWLGLAKMAVKAPPLAKATSSRQVCDVPADQPLDAPKTAKMGPLLTAALSQVGC